jgi:hypothetical protein
MSRSRHDSGMRCGASPLARWRFVLREFAAWFRARSGRET